MLRLLLASEDGYLYVYSLDVNEGNIYQFHEKNIILLKNNIHRQFYVNNL